MVEFTLSEEQEMLRELAHEFARDTVRPNAEHWKLIRNFQLKQLRKLMH